MLQLFDIKFIYRSPLSKSAIYMLDQGRFFNVEENVQQVSSVVLISVVHSQCQVNRNIC